MRSVPVSLPRPLRVAGAALLLMLGAACAEPETPASIDSAVVKRVADGDTLVLAGGSRVRLVQIDAPEVGGGECYAAASTRALTRLVQAGARITLDADPRLDQLDRHGRLLRYVHLAGRNLNVELVRLGAATPYFRRATRGRYADELLDANDEARSERRGIWAACRVSWNPDRQVQTRPR